ncbi:hypothetical protein ABWL39_06055 [Chitinivorax sp. PXF-14]|uniref:hypothetical protein n=1 Tax=Chitinivorax sp. PXF-14 TaxID=3230488 RepID=UPI00346760D7
MMRPPGMAPGGGFKHRAWRRHAPDRRGANSGGRIVPVGIDEQIGHGRASYRISR